MGQCVSRDHPGPYAFSRHYDAESVASSISGSTRRGHSESKGAKKREKSASGNGNKPTRGVATSFGFRRRPASTSRADDNARRKQKSHDKNGNGGSTEDLRPEEVLSGRSTPLARPRKEISGQPLRTNRFGFRQPHSKTAKVADVNVPAGEAFSAPVKDKETAINNNTLDKKSTNQYNLPLLATQVSSTGVTNIVGVAGVPKPVTKQTVILTYQPQQYPHQDIRKPPRAGDQSGSRATSTPRQVLDAQKPPGKYTFQTNQLPRPQYPSVKNIDSKSAKQVVNNTRKAGAVDGWREGAGSAVSSDSGVWTGGEGGELSPRSRRRPRNLEMVMRGSHSFHLRELQVADLDIMDEAVVTGHAVIPLPKLPSSFNDESSPESEPIPTYMPTSPIVPKPTPIPEPSQRQNSPMSTLERYRNRTRPSRIQTNLEYKDEEKFVLDRAQPEILNKQKSFIKSSSGVASPATVDSSKESSPSCKSEASNFGNSSAWQSHAAGEAMATRSQDDVSIALSVSSCEDDKSKLLETKEVDVEVKRIEPKVPTKTIVIAVEPPVPHPLLMKSLTLSQHDVLRGTMMGSMTSSNYSTTSTCTNQSVEHNLTLTLEESKFDISALETSTQSLLDDETSPADSLISSTSTSDSNNDLHIERDPPSISSAYQTANTKTRTPEPIVEEDDRVDGEILQPVKEGSVSGGSGDSGGSKNITPPSPGTPTHASGSLSLSDGRDFFDDEIADQPALLFRKNNHGSPSVKRADSDPTKNLRKSRDHVLSSPQAQRSRKCVGRNPATERTASLDTLSSLASDDLMMDNDLAQSITSLQSVDDYIERLDSSLRSGLNSLDERQLHQELSSSKTAIRQWSQLLEKNNLLDMQLAAMAQGKIAADSLTGSTTSLSNLGASLPVRTARLLQRSRTQTPSDAGVSDGSTSPAPAPSSLLQDVVDIKTLLLQLKRVLQEPGEEHHSMSSETLDPLLAACAESPARGNGRRPPASPLHPDACAEMRRQIVYLQGQLEERDRLVRVLQQQMLRMAESHEPRSDDTCNVATQTDRLRPPIGTTLASSENSGLVSWNEQASGKKLPSYSEAQKTKRPVSNGTVKCQCGARKVNGVTNDDNRLTDKRTDSVQLKSNSRVGSKYLQALATNTESRRYIKRDSSVGEKSERKNLYSGRSRSIENFHNQHYLTTEPLLSKTAVIEEFSIKHHTSYGDLYNGRISSKESVNGNRHSPSLNGQSTDTDYSSDGGYKSLPSSINYNGCSPKKVSGIPRRSIEQRLVSPKQVRASAI
ncbi:serine-rich adhesin for platelets isoform X2 [Maniola hyperantus]|uniref:serine-rich adhesin for platelets isoform X2 n=1 Tax=Aphantopus hyperantus TaxID=2795564 RepID=UPI0037495578